MRRSAKRYGLLVVGVLIALAGPVRAQEPVSSARADSILEDSLWHAQLRKLFRRKTDTTQEIPAAVTPPARPQTPNPVDTTARARVDTVKPPPPSLGPRAAPVHIDTVAPPRAAPVRARIDTVKPPPVLAPRPAPVRVDTAPAVRAQAPRTPIDTGGRAHVDTVKPRPAPAAQPAPVHVDAAPGARAQVPNPRVDTVTPVRIDTIKAPPALAPRPAPIPVADTSLPVRAQAPKADTGTRARVDTIAPQPVPAAAAPAAAPAVRPDSSERIRERADSIQRVGWGGYVWRRRQCQGCHELGRDQSSGPNLIGVTERRTLEWLRRWLKNPVEMAAEDSIGIALKKKYSLQMPDMQLSHQDIEGLISYLAWATMARSSR